MREQALLLQATLDNMDQGLVMVDADGTIKVCNRRAIELLELPEDLMLSRPRFADVLRYQIGRGDFVKSDLSLQKWVETDNIEHTQHTYERERPNGTTLEVRSVRAPDGGMLRTYTDITDRKRAEASLRMAELEYRSLFENAVVGIYRASPDGVKLRVNPALVRLNGYDTEEEMLSAQGRANVWYVEPGRFSEFMAELGARGRVSDFVSEVYRAGTSERMWVSETAWTVPDGTGEAFFEGTVVDATERKRAEAEIEHLARHDPLTALPNRVLFRETLNEKLAAEPRTDNGVAVLCLDLDRFKTVNDSLGHLVGDALLRTVAERISRAAATGDTVARLGGDEFVVIHAASNGRDGVAHLAERLIQLIGQPMLVDGHQLTVGVSIGIAIAREGDRDAEQLLKSSDLALYRAKAGGRNTFRFYEREMDAAAEERRRLELDLRGALARREFEVHYQPVLNIATGEITGFEALVRWRHPARGLVSPGDFITVAEETGLIVPIGKWVLRQACLEAASWPAAIKVAVNISAVQFRHSDISNDVISALAAAELNPNRLELEITESIFLEESTGATASLHRMHDLGIRIALDDFGTGFSSLNYLRRFPFDKIKIDQCFTRDLRASDGSLAIVRAIIGIGSDLGVTITAEGVETEAQLEMLAAEGCQEVQGYLFSRPVPAASIPELIAALGTAVRFAA